MLFFYKTSRYRLAYGLSLLFLLFCSEQVRGQSVGDYRTNGNATFLSATGWQRYDGSTWVSAVSAPTSADGIITISTNSAAIVTADISLDQIVVQGFLNINAGVTLTLLNGVGDDLTVSGAGAVYNRGTINNCASGTLSPANLFTTDAWASPKGTYISPDVSEPTTEATFLFFNQSSTTTHIYWQKSGSGKRRLVVLKPASAVDVNALTDGTTYTADVAYGSGTAVDGGFVVFDGVGGQVNVTGLTNATTYHIAIFEYNSDCSNASPNYKMGTPLAGSFLTGERAFITTWITTDNTIFIPTFGGGYNYNVAWFNQTSSGVGNGSATAQIGDYTLTGLTNGHTYRVEITGDFPRIYFNNTGDKTKIRTIQQWGSQVWASMESAFSGCTNLTYTATDQPNLNLVTNLSSIFSFCTSFNGNIINWNSSSVTNVQSAFQQASSFNRNIGRWNVSNITNMNSMFRQATTFNQNISSWNTSSVIDMNSMFQQMNTFNQAIGSWNTSAVTNMGYMFQQTNTFNQNIGNWNVSEVTNMNSMFRQSAVFNQNIGNWNVSNVIFANGMFIQATFFNQNIGNWNTSKISDMGAMFLNATAFNQNIGLWNTSAVTNMSLMFSGATTFNQNIGSWILNSGINLTNMLDNCGMNRANYDATLAGWASQSVTGRTLGASGRQYCNITARNNLDITKAWTITGDALSGSCPPISSPARGTMLSLDGTDDRISIPDNATLNITTNQLTLSAWVKRDAAGTFDNIIMKGSYGYGLIIDENDRLGYWSDVNYSNCFNSGANTIPANVWTHVAVVVNAGTSTTLYINGVNVGVSGAGNAIINNNTGILAFGTQDIGNCDCNNHGGNIDEVQIWNTARTQAQIRESMHLTLSGLESGLVAYYQFNETTGSVIDAVNSNNGTLENGASRVTSTVSVGKGVSKTASVTSVGAGAEVSLATTNMEIDFSAGSANPNGEIVISQITAETPHQNTNTNNNTTSCYWVVRNFGTNTGLAFDNIRFQVPSNNRIATEDETTPANLKLYRRDVNSGGTWTQVADANSASNTTKQINFDTPSNTSFSEFVIGADISPLPITLLGLKGRRVEGLRGEGTEEVKLEWSTASEINNKGFEIEMSENGRDYQKIAFVEGRGSGSSYQFAVSNSSDSYYRLRQLDFDGTFSYSPVVFVEGIEILKVYPNPNHGVFTISVGKDKLDAPMYLLNAQGKEVWRGVQTEVRTTGLVSGLYFLHTVVAGKVKVVKVVIQ